MMDSTHELSMRGMRDGIKLNTMAPYHPAYNGVVERMIGYSPMPCALAVVESKSVSWTWRSFFFFLVGAHLINTANFEGRRATKG